MRKSSFQDNDIFAHSNICLFSSSSSRTVHFQTTETGDFVCLETKWNEKTERLLRA